MTIEIAGKRTDLEWRALEVRLKANFNNDELWSEAFKFCEERLNHRYIYPAEQIQNNSLIIGEGFAITAILCSLIEALETFYEGKCYKHDMPRNNHEYGNGNSQKLYVDFLTKKEPFNKEFNEDLAIDFYRNVRCALLHEAATRNGWVIRIDTQSLVEVDKDKKIINRDIFLNCIKQYIKSYRLIVLGSEVRKNAFIRKIDCICRTV